MKERPAERESKRGRGEDEEVAAHRSGEIQRGFG